MRELVAVDDGVVERHPLDRKERLLLSRPLAQHLLQLLAVLHAVTPGERVARAPFHAGKGALGDPRTPAPARSARILSNLWSRMAMRIFVSVYALRSLLACAARPRRPRRRWRSAMRLRGPRPFGALRRPGPGVPIKCRRVIHKGAHVGQCALTMPLSDATLTLARKAYMDITAAARACARGYSVRLSAGARVFRWIGVEPTTKLAGPAFALVRRPWAKSTR